MRCTCWDGSTDLCHWQNLNILSTLGSFLFTVSTKMAVKDHLLLKTCSCTWVVMGSEYFSHWTNHYSDVIMDTMASQITSVLMFTQPFIHAQIKKHQSSALLAFVRGIHRRPVNCPHKGPVSRKMFPFDDVIMYSKLSASHYICKQTNIWTWQDHDQVTKCGAKMVKNVVDNRELRMNSTKQR